MSINTRWSKLTYFKHAQWEPDWIDIVETLMCNTFECSYSTSEHTSDNDSESDEKPVEKPVKQSKTTNMFDDMVASPPHTSIDRCSEFD